MYFFLTQALKNRFILELRRFWGYHPKYRGIVGNIQGKYRFEERPQVGITVKNTGGNHVALSADNYVGIVQAYTYLTKVKDAPGVSIEWVREDSVAIQNNRGTFPSLPGVYYIEIVEDSPGPGGVPRMAFYVDPLLDVAHEQVLQVDPVTFQLANIPLSGTLRLFEQPSGFMLHEGVNYSVTATGEITLVEPLGGGRSLQADYRYPVPSRGPFPFAENTANNAAIPGVVLAFGRRASVGDKMAVVVHSVRQPVALEYGGKWDLNMEIEVVARDVYVQQEISDFSVIFIWGVLRSQLTREGIELNEISLGGESEEIYDDAGEDYFYTSSFSVTAQTEWSLHVPLDMMIRSAAPLTSEQIRAQAALSDAEIGDSLTSTNIRVMDSLGLEGLRDPFFMGRSATYEMIK